MTTESTEAGTSAAELADLMESGEISCALADAGNVVAVALAGAGYKAGDVQAVRRADGSLDDGHVKIPVFLHDGPGEATLTVSLG